MSDTPSTPSNILPGPGYQNSTTVMGPPGGGDWEGRLQAVEADTRDIKAILQRLEPVLTRVDGSVRKIETDTLPKLQSELAETRGRVAQLPTSLAVFAYIGSVFGLAIALVGITVTVVKVFGH